MIPQYIGCYTKGCYAFIEVSKYQYPSLITYIKERGWVLTESGQAFCPLHKGVIQEPLQEKEITF